MQVRMVVCCLSGLLEVCLAEWVIAGRGLHDSLR